MPEPPISAAELAAIAARVTQATPGPWYRVDLPWGDGLQITNGRGGDPHGGVTICCIDDMSQQWESGDDRTEQWLADLAFIAHARDDVPKLIAEIERLAFLHDQDHKLADHWQQQLEALRAAAAALPEPWSGERGYCIFCGTRRVRGHAPGCGYAALRALLPPAGAGDG